MKLSNEQIKFAKTWRTSDTLLHSYIQKEKYFQFAEKFTKEMIELSKKKNADYTGASDNPFANFSSVEEHGISTEQGFIVRMNDKLKRLSSFVGQGILQVKDESVTDTLQDLANYCVLFAGYLNSKNKKYDRTYNSSNYLSRRLNHERFS